MVDMDGVDDVNWADLEHAYGPATDVPDLLAKLASNDQADSNNALYALYGSLFHQGTVYSATVACTPFIIDLALQRQTLCRTELLDYLGRLVEEFGDEPPDLDELDLPDSFDREEIAARLAEQVVHVQAIGDTLEKRADDLRALVGDDDLDLAIAAATILANLGHEDASQALTELIAQRPVRYAIVVPSDSISATEIAESVGRPNLVHAPFVFYAGDTSALDEIIVEDLADFPRDLMDDAGEIADELYAETVAYSDPSLQMFRFYAGMTVAELDEICAAQGWERVDVSDEPPIPADEAPDSGKAWDDFTAAERELVERFVETLDEAGWQETRPWHENLKSCGWNVSPQGVGRYFGADAMLEVGLWLYDPIASAEVTGFVGEPHVRLVIHNDSDTALPLRFYGGLATILEVLIERQRDVTPANYIETLLPEMSAVCHMVLAEANGGLMKLE